MERDFRQVSNFPLPIDILNRLHAVLKKKSYNINLLYIGHGIVIIYKWLVSSTFVFLITKSKKKLRRGDLEDQFMENQDELFRKGQEIVEKDQEIQTLKEKLKEIENNQKTLDANREVNQPSSKKPEWDKDGNLSSGKSKKKKNGGRRKGSGNKKKYLIPTEENTTPLNSCPDCGSNLQDQPVLETRSRLVEDIPENQEPVVSEEIIERKWCSTCRKTASSLSERALPGSDYGLNTMILCTYLWVETASAPRNHRRLVL